MRWWQSLLAAIQFNTRLRLPPLRQFDETTLPRSLLFFPLTGGLIGMLAAVMHALLAPHLGRLPSATLTVLTLVLATGALHEDGLADCADAFGGGWTRERMLEILRDSRIGTYGAAALGLGLLLRVTVLASMPLAQLPRTLVAAHILCRWTTLPLSYWLPAARAKTDGQAAGIARNVAGSTLVIATAYSWVAVGFLMRWRAVPAVLLACVVAALSGMYYKRQLGGITGDCLGASNQLVEMMTYLAGAWTR